MIDNAVIEDFNKNKKEISSFCDGIQREIAIEMWDYVRKHLYELHDMLTDEEIDSGEIDYAYDALERIKEDFSEEFRKKTGVKIDWRNYCVLCHKFSCVSIHTCPLGSCDYRSDNPYYTVVKYALHKTTYEQACESIDFIIKKILEAL